MYFQSSISAFCLLFFCSTVLTVVDMSGNDKKIWELPCLIKFGQFIRVVVWDP